MTFAASHNGGLVQINSTLLNTDGCFPFLNLLKNGTSWGRNGANTSPVTPDELDSNGYPNALSISRGGTASICYAPSQAERIGNYVITWTSSGTILLNFSNTVLPTATFTGSVSSNILTAGAPSGGTIQKGMTLSTGGIIGDQISGSAGVAGTYNLVNGVNAGSQSMTVSGGSTTSAGNGRYVFSTTATRFDFHITNGPITNVIICHVDDEARITAGEVFGVKFKQTVSDMRFGVWRAGVGWQNSNTSQVTTWATRKPMTFYSYIAAERRAAWFAGTCTNTANAYVTASFPSQHAADGTSWTSGVPKDKDIVHVIWGANATPSGGITLDIGTSGTPINVLDPYTNALATSTYPAQAGTVNDFSTLVYDAQLNVWIKQGGDTTQFAKGFDNAVPPELVVQLCGEIGMHPYFVVPYLSCTPMTDWTRQCATYCLNNGPSWMVPMFEGPNELWNFAANYYQGPYSNNVANSYGWGSSGTQYHEWYGKVMSTIGQDVAAAYSVIKANVKTQTKYKVLCGVQTANAVNGTGTATSNPRLNSTKYLTGVPAAQAGYALDAAKDWVTHICTAQYYNSSAQTDGSATTLANNFNGKIFTASCSAGVMTVSAIVASASGAISVGDTVFDSPIFLDSGITIPNGTKITSLGTGTGTTGTYNLSNSISFSSRNCSAAADLTAPTTYAAACRSGSYILRLDSIIGAYSTWKTWASGLNVNKMCGYEGSYSFAASGGNTLLAFLGQASKQDTNIFYDTFTNYNGFAALTDGSFTAEFPAFLSFSGDISISGYDTGVWSMFSDLYQSPYSAQASAVQLYNNRKRRFTVTT
jgi:hypothetical protein